MKKQYLFFISILFIFGCQMSPPDKMLSDFEKEEVLTKQEDLQYYLSENVNYNLTGEGNELNLSETYSVIILKNKKEGYYYANYDDNVIRFKTKKIKFGQKVIAKIVSYNKKDKFYNGKVLKNFPNRHEIFITDQLFGKSYGILGDKSVYVEEANLGDKIIVEITSAVEESGNFYAKIIKHITNVATKISGNIKIGSEYELVILNKNKKRGFYGLINDKKVIVIGATGINKKYKVKILSKEDEFYYSQIVYN